MSYPKEYLLELWDRRRARALMREVEKARLARQVRKARSKRDTAAEQATKKAGTAAARTWTTLAATILALMLAAAVAFGESPTLCQQAYLMSGLNPQRTSFEEFAELHGDTFCAASGDVGSPAD